MAGWMLHRSWRESGMAQELPHVDVPNDQGTDFTALGCWATGRLQVTHKGGQQMSWGQPKNWTPKWRPLLGLLTLACKLWRAGSFLWAHWCPGLGLCPEKRQETVGLGQGAAHDRRDEFVTSTEMAEGSSPVGLPGTAPPGPRLPGSPSGSHSPPPGCEDDPLANQQYSPLTPGLTPPTPTPQPKDQVLISCAKKKIIDIH